MAWQVSEAMQVAIAILVCTHARAHVSESVSSELDPCRNRNPQSRKILCTHPIPFYGTDRKRHWWSRITEIIIGHVIA